MVNYSYVPNAFGVSYTVPIPKGDFIGKSLTVDDFRGIAISPVISKLFEHCILNRFSAFLKSSDNQFGFKKKLGCAHAVFSLRKIVNLFNAGSSTVSMCAIDLSKAYDKVNHFGLFMIQSYDTVYKRHATIYKTNGQEYSKSSSWIT